MNIWAMIILTTTATIRSLATMMMGCFKTVGTSTCMFGLIMLLPKLPTMVEANIERQPEQRAMFLMGL